MMNVKRIMVSTSTSDPTHISNSHKRGPLLSVHCVRYLSQALSPNRNPPTMTHSLGWLCEREHNSSPIPFPNRSLLRGLE